MKKIIAPIVVIAILIGLIIAFLKLEEIRTTGTKIINNISNNDEIIVNSFESCVLANYPVQESYPRRCVLPDGTGFTEDIEREIEYDIILESPRPNEVVRSPIVITGEAVGPWFFEANFTAELVDGEGEVIAIAILTAEGEWMTEELVPFSGELEFEGSSGQGELVLKSANPSGLPEHQKIFSIPVRY